MRWPFLVSEHSCHCQGLFYKIFYLIKNNDSFSNFNMSTLLYLYRQWKKNRSYLELRSNFNSFKKILYSQSLKLWVSFHNKIWDMSSLPLDSWIHFTYIFLYLMAYRDSHGIFWTLVTSDVQSHSLFYLLVCNILPCEVSTVLTYLICYSKYFFFFYSFISITAVLYPSREHLMLWAQCFACELDYSVLYEFL